MVAVVVVAMLALVAPAYKSMVQRSRDVKCLANLRQISALASQYSASTGTYLPALNGLRWYDLLADAGLVSASEKRHGGILRCVSSKGVARGGVAPGYLAQDLVNYSVNAYLGQVGGAYNITPARVGQVPRVSSIILALDAPYRVPRRELATSLGLRPEINTSVIAVVTGFLSPEGEGPPHGRPVKDADGTYHGGGVNAVFLDGSARYLSMDDADFNQRPNASNGATNYWTTGKTPSSGPAF